MGKKGMWEKEMAGQLAVDIAVEPLGNEGGIPRVYVKSTKYQSSWYRISEPGGEKALPVKGLEKWLWLKPVIEPVMAGWEW